MLCCCERDEQTSSRIMSDYNIDLGEWGVSSVPALMAKIAVFVLLNWTPQLYRMLHFVWIPLLQGLFMHQSIFTLNYDK